jgi:hypothetical protein
VIITAGPPTSQLRCSQPRTRFSALTPSPPQPSRPASASGTASPAAPTPSPPSAGPARSPRRLERLHPPGRRAAHPKAPRPPRPARPPPRSPPPRHQERQPHQPGPPARDHRRHPPPAHRARRAAHADRLRPALRPRRPPRPGITRPVPKEQERQSRNVIPNATRDCSLTRQPARRELFNYNETPSSRCSSSRDPYRSCREPI